MSKPERTVVEFLGSELIQILLEHQFKGRGAMTVDGAMLSWTTSLTENVDADKFKIKLSWVSVKPYEAAP